jgi:hypothetical protein
MTDQANLERGYRRLLACYPRAFRRENGQEILAVLMACAPDGQRRPGPVLAATMFAHESAAFDAHVLAGLGGDVG